MFETTTQIVTYELYNHSGSSGSAGAIDFQGQKNEDWTSYLLEAMIVTTLQSTWQLQKSLVSWMETTAMLDPESHGGSR